MIGVGGGQQLELQQLLSSTLEGVVGAVLLLFMIMVLREAVINSIELSDV